MLKSTVGERDRQKGRQIDRQRALKQSAEHTTILAKILPYTHHAGVSHFVQALHSSFLKTTSLSVRECVDQFKLLCLESVTSLYSALCVAPKICENH